MTDEIKIFVYGSCHFSERLDSDEAVGNGGYGVVICKNGKKIEEFSGGFSNTTNARMDIIAITKVLEKITETSNIIVYLSNGYVIDTLTKGWLEKWKKNGFKKKKHVELWITLDKVLSANSHSISYRHSRDVKFDSNFQLAKQAAKAMSGKKNLSADLKTDNNANLFSDSTDNNEEENEKVLIDNTPILDSICVDASSLSNPGPTEYRTVDTQTKQIISEYKLGEATNNIGEFLAIVHALTLYKKQGKELKVIYSYSQTAISWLKQKTCKTKLEETEDNIELFEILTSDIYWLKDNDYTTKVLKWNSGAWGEIPADYGRK
jgi:ribonuclease HI